MRSIALEMPEKTLEKEQARKNVGEPVEEFAVRLGAVRRGERLGRTGERTPTWGPGARFWGMRVPRKREALEKFWRSARGRVVQKSGWCRAHSKKEKASG